MPFEPKSDDHAIVEVVFGLTMARPFSAAELEAFSAAHDLWKDFLPKMGRAPLLQFNIGDTPQSVEIPIAFPAGGVSFERIKPDGDLEWRLRAQQSSIHVNCLAYTRWTDVWTRAQAYMQQASEILIAEDNTVKSVALQYIDVFEWRGDSTSYDANLLLRSDSELVPASIRDKGQLWHLHLGWFSAPPPPFDGRMLERIHIDSVSDDKGRPTSRFDTIHRVDLGTPLSKEDAIGPGAVACDIFKELHIQNKRLMKCLLTDDLAQRIQLNAP